MAIGADLPELETPAGTAFEFPANDGEASSPLSAKLPRRLRRRLSSETKAPSTAEEIDAKLREASLRRQAKAQKQGDLRLRKSIKRPEKMHEQGELLSRMLARCWRQFVRLRKTTFSLVKAYEALAINESSVKAMCFEDLAICIESGTTLQIVRALLERLEKRLIISQASRKGSPGVENVDHLLKHVVTQNRKSDTAKRGIKKKSTALSTEMLKTLKHLPRYPARVVLCAYMISGHPEAVFYGKVGSEVALAKSAADFIREFELLIRVILHGPQQNSPGNSPDNSDNATATSLCFRSQLEAFDRAWCSYLYDFVAWKVEDSKLLEKELINAACELKISIMQSSNLNEQDQVNEGLKLIRARLGQISGTAGIEHLDRALDDVRSRFHEAEEFRVSSIRNVTSQDSASAISDEDRDPSESQRSIQTAPSSFDEKPSFSSKLASSSSVPRGLNVMSHENEALVNEIVHGQCGVADKFVTDDHQDGLKNKVRETMEKAFWDALMESMKKDQPNFSWALKLIKEVRDQLHELSPQQWRKEITEAIDVDTLSEEVKSGVLDVVSLQKILEFALLTLRKLSSPANDDEMRMAHSNLLKEIGEISQAADGSDCSLAIAIIKGLQFVLQQIQILKREISKARIRLIEPLIKGPTGMEYLTKAFTEHYGPPADASSTLPLTAQWISSTLPSTEPEWEEHVCSLGNIMANNRMDSQGLPSISLRAGGAVSATSRILPPVSVPSGKEQPECRGEKVDIVLRLGLLKLVSGLEGLKLDELPETLKLNFSRLRAVQSQLQKIIVISTSALVLRQTLLSENSIRTALDVEQVNSDCIKQLSDLLDSSDDAGIAEIVGTISSLLEHKLEPEKLQSANLIMANLLVKSLQAGNPVFTKVSQAVYVAARGVVLGGTGLKGRQLAEDALRRIGASALVDRLVHVMEVLVTVAAVSRVVHDQWYEALLGSL